MLSSGSHMFTYKINVVMFKFFVCLNIKCVMVREVMKGAFLMYNQTNLCTSIYLCTSEYMYRVRNLKFARNLIFATSKTLVNFMKKMMFCLKFSIFQFKKPEFIVHLTNLTSISLFYWHFNMWRISDMWRILDFLL